MSESASYKGKINFYVVPVDSDKVEAEITRWAGLGTHGLVGTNADGGMLVLLPGHNFGEPAIVGKLDELLRLTTSPGP